MSEHDDLTTTCGLLSEAFGNSLHATMVKRRDGIVDNNAVITANLIKFR